MVSLPLGQHILQLQGQGGFQALGGGLGVLGYFFMPDYPAGDVLSAIAVGIVSGMAALGGRRLMGREGSKKNEDGGKE